MVKSRRKPYNDSPKPYDDSLKSYNDSFKPHNDNGAPRTAGDTTAANLDRERIARRAYELYLSRGGGDGMDMDDWLSAERELGTAGNPKSEA